MYTSGFSKLAVVCPYKNCKGVDGILLPLIETPIDQYNFAVQWYDLLLITGAI